MSERTMPEWLQNFLSNPTDDLGNDIISELRNPKSHLTEDLRVAAEEGILGSQGEKLYGAVSMMQLWVHERQSLNVGSGDLNHSTPLLTNRDLRTLRVQIAMNAVTGEHPVYEDDMGEGIRTYGFPSELHAVAALTDIIGGHGGRALRTIMERRLPSWARHREAVRSVPEPQGSVPHQKALAASSDKEVSPLTGLLSVDPNQLDRQSRQMIAGLQTASLAVERSLGKANVLERAQVLMAQAMEGVAGVLHGLTAQDHELLRHAMGERHVRHYVAGDATQGMGFAAGYGMLAEGMGQADLLQMQQSRSRSMTLAVEEHGPSHPMPDYKRWFDVKLPPIEVTAVRAAGFATGSGGHYEERGHPDGVVVDAWAGRDGTAGGVVGVDIISVGQAEIHTSVSFSSGR